MEKYLIKIDRDSIKVNENAGVETTKVLGKRDITFTCSKMPDILVDEENCFIAEVKFDTEAIDRFSGMIYDIDLVDKLRDEKYSDCHFIINVNNNIETLNHFPIPKYSFEYEPLKVKCEDCGHEFMSNEFLHLENDDDYTYTGCPHCCQYGCCDVGYEKISDIEHEL